MGGGCGGGGGGGRDGEMRSGGLPRALPSTDGMGGHTGNASGALQAPRGKGGVGRGAIGTASHLPRFRVKAAGQTGTRAWHSTPKRTKTVAIATPQSPGHDGYNVPLVHDNDSLIPPPLQAAQPMPSHCLPDAKCQPQWHL